VQDLRAAIRSALISAKKFDLWVPSERVYELPDASFLCEYFRCLGRLLEDGHLDKASREALSWKPFLHREKLPLNGPRWAEEVPKLRYTKAWSRWATVMTLKTLGDARSLLSHLPKDVRARSTWQHVAADLDWAAGGGDTMNVSVPLQMVLGMERVERRK